MTITTKQLNWDFFHLFMAFNYSTKSKDPSTKTGCVIVNEENIPVGWGYNGLSKWMDEQRENEVLDDRDQKYPRVIHAELNAVLNASGSLKGATAYVTHPPCPSCFNILSQAGVTKAVTIEPSEEFAKRWDEEVSLKESEDVKVHLVILKRELAKEYFGDMSQSMLDLI